MNVLTSLFYVFAFLLLFAAFKVITAHNPVHATLFLVLAFFQAAMIWMLLKAEFLSIALVLVYVGAVMVLFLFVVMMMDVNMSVLSDGFWKSFPFAALIGVIVALEMAGVLMGGFREIDDSTGVAKFGHFRSETKNTQELGRLLFTEYLFPLEVAAAILFVAMIAAIALTLRVRKDSKYVSPSDQVKVKARDRLRLVKMEAASRSEAPLSSS